MRWLVPSSRWEFGEKSKNNNTDARRDAKGLIYDIIRTMHTEVTLLAGFTRPIHPSVCLPPTSTQSLRSHDRRCRGRTPPGGDTPSSTALFDRTVTVLERSILLVLLLVVVHGGILVVFGIAKGWQWE